MAKSKQNKEDQEVIVSQVNNTSTDSVQDQLDKAEEFVNKNKNILSYVGGAILLVVGLIVGGKYYLSTQDQEAQTLIFQAQYYLEADSLKKALNGDGNNLGFLEISETYPFTPTANLANYCAGLIYLKQGKFDEAIDYLKKFGSDDIIFQSRSYSLIGDAYMEKGEFENAAEYYSKASSYQPTKEFTPEYLMKWALACEKAKDYETAIKAYDKILTKYPNSQRSNDAKKYKALVEELASTN